jgi:hypothetical protein
MRLNLPRLRGRRTPVGVAILSEEQWEDPPGTVRFETAWAKHRFIQIEPMGDAVHFVAPLNRYWPGQTGPDVATPQVVTRGTLPDTVTCGGGYIEVLAFTERGIVVNEVRTHGDQVIAMPGWAQLAD